MRGSTEATTSAVVFQPRRRMRLTSHIRAAALFFVLSLLISSILYPFAITAFAELVSPATAGGSLVRVNGTVVGSSLVAQNLSAPFLFWERPSLADYNTTVGAPSPPGPTEPALRALLNETIAYMLRYGNATVNGSFPLSLVSPSASGLDPVLPPDAVLIQVPRVAHFTNLTLSDLQGLVNRHTIVPFAFGFGVPYVNVLALDIALLSALGR